MSTKLILDQSTNLKIKYILPLPLRKNTVYSGLKIVTAYKTFRWFLNSTKSP